MLITTRVFAFCGFSTETATAVVAAGGATDITLASAIASVPLLVLGVYSASSAWVAITITRPALSWNRVLPLLAPFCVIFALAVLLVPVSYLLLAPSASSVIAVTIRISRPTSGSTRSSVPVTPELARSVVFSWVVLLVLGLSTTSWLPAEAITTSDGRIVTGYVVGNQQGTLSVLTDRRILVRIPTAEAHRRLCEKPVTWDTATVLRIIRDDRYPTCPD